MWLAMGMLGTAVSVAMIGVMIVGPFMALFYAWGEWQGAIHEARLPVWRHGVIIVGLLAVTCQAIYFLLLWTPLGSHRILLRRAVPTELFLVLPTVLSTFIWKKNARWWLLASSIFLCVSSFFTVLAEVAY
jgi:hypothetical protein